MARPKLAPDVIDAILAAPTSEPPDAVAARLGVSASVVKKYRRDARQERQEVARTILARHVEENIPDALADLTALRQKARTAYETGGDCRDGNLWLAAIKTTLEHVKPDDSELDAAIERELAELADRGEAAPPDAAAEPEG